VTLVAWYDREGRLPKVAPVSAGGRWSGRVVPLASRDPAAWLSVWLGGGVVRWDPGGLSGIQPVGRSGNRVLPEENATALLWPCPRGVRAFSHRALWSAARGTADLGAAGRGLPGPVGVLQGWASWLLGEPFGAGRFLYQDPCEANTVTDGVDSWAYDADVLGVWARGTPEGLGVGPDVLWDPATGRVRTARLLDGWWSGGDWNPMRVDPGGWHRPVGVHGAGEGEGGAAWQT
jgi:hypothetical protein